MVGRLRQSAIATLARLVVEHEKGLVRTIVDLRNREWPRQHSTIIVLTQAVLL